MFITFVTIILVLFAWLYWNAKRKFNFWKDRGIAGPSPSFPFGNSLSLLSKNRALLDLELATKYGKIYGFYQGTKPQLLVTDAELIKTILVKDFQHFMNRQKVNFYHEMWNENLFNANDGKWKRIRTITTPAFTSGKLRKMHSMMENCIGKLIDYLDSVSGRDDNPGLIKDTKEVITGFTVDVIAITSFATETNSNSSRQEPSPFVANGKDLFNVRQLRAFIAFTFPKFLVKLFQVKTFFSPKPFNFFIDLSREIVRQRQASGVKRNDFVQLLLDSGVDEKELENVSYDKLATSLEKDGDDSSTKLSAEHSTSKKTLSEKEIIAQCFLFFIAGMETTASTICHVIYELSKNPEIQERLWREIVDATRGLTDTSSDEYFEKVVNDIPYLEAVIKEGLRMYPPFSVLFRRVSTDGYKLAGIQLPRDTMVEISAYVVHYNPEYYPEPEKFNPDRFLPENKDQLVPYTYLPFGAGPRNCVGLRFAYQEIKLLLVRLLKRYRFEQTPETPAKLSFQKGSPLLLTETFPCRIVLRQ